MPPSPQTGEPVVSASAAGRTRPRGQRRLLALFSLLIVILLLTFIPPLLNVSRFQQRIARNISASIGRPVHFDKLSLNLLPLPGFTLDNFVVEEDPAFGSEPVLFADTVRADLRFSSLWRRAEFSKISLTDPSVNLVRDANGRWNIEGILLQASRIEAAPTAQPYAGPARRFPYIEATGARLNLKLGEEKTPFSLTDADFALWLPEPHQWHLRLEAHPLRTDSTPGDTGTIRLEGTLGNADVKTDSLADIPINLQGDWRDAQLGGLGRLIFGNDSGLRGDLSITFATVGTVGQNVISTTIKIEKARRADFVPDRLVSLEATCNASAQNSFQAFRNIDCHWPPAGSSDPRLLVLTADLPDVRRPGSATVNLNLPSIPAETFFDWLHVATPHAPSGAGTLTGSLALNPAAHSAGPSQPDQAAPQPGWSGQLEFASSSIELDPHSHRSLELGDVVLRSTPLPAPVAAHARRAAPPAAPLAPDSFDLLPISLPLGGKQPATLEGHVDDSGYTFHLTGTVICANLLELANAIPQFGDGLEQVLDKIAAATPDPSSATKPEPVSETKTAGKQETGAEHILSSVPIHVDLTATRSWGSGQTWSETEPAPPHRPIHPSAAASAGN
jgi:AsmA protein